MSGRNIESRRLLSLVVVQANLIQLHLLSVQRYFYEGRLVD